MAFLNNPMAALARVDAMSGVQAMTTTRPTRTMPDDDDDGGGRTSEGDGVCAAMQGKLCPADGCERNQGRFWEITKDCKYTEGACTPLACVDDAVMIGLE